MKRSGRTTAALALAVAAGTAAGTATAAALRAYRRERRPLHPEPAAPEPAAPEPETLAPGAPESGTFATAAPESEALERQRIALHDVARDLSGSASIQQAIRTIAESAVRTTHALGAYVERIETPGAAGMVEVVAVAGSGGPPLGTRIPYPGSLSEEIIEAGEPEIMVEVGAIEERMAPFLHENCRHCSGLVAPLAAEKMALGALVLLRRPEQPHFTAADASLVRSLGDLATAAFQRLLLHEELEESELRFRQIVDNLHEVAWLDSPDLSICYYINPAYERVWGRSLESAYEDPLSPLEAIIPEDLPRVQAWLAEFGQGRNDVEYRIVRPDGEMRWIWSRAYPVRNTRGEVYRIAGITEDITERKLAEGERHLLLQREREAREEIASILESISDAFYALDREWRFTYVNRETERILGRAAERFIGKKIWDKFPELVGTIVEREYRLAVRERRAVYFEFFYEPLSIWLDVRAYPSANGLSVFYRDVTERRRVEDELRESEQNLRALANSIPQVVWIATPDGEVVWYNQRWYDYTGATLEETKGLRWQTLVHPEHRARVVAGSRRAYQTGEPWEDVLPLRGRTGDYRWFLSRMVPVRDSAGRVVRWFGTDTDINDRIEAEAERARLLEGEREARAEAERRREELERVTESRARLIRGFSHDVKNPLGAADGFLQLLEEGLLGHLAQQQTEGVARARNALHGALELIDDILAFARAQTGDIEVTPVPTDMAMLARTVAEGYQAQAAAKGLTLATDLPATLPTIESDPDRIRQILGNLLSNAVKYTEHGGILVTATVCEGTAECGSLGGPPATGRWIAVAVSDTGPGIPRERQHLLFQEFSRLAPKGAARGAGIGLFISQRMARALGGEITLMSEAGKGSTFTLWLPAGLPGARDIP
jgi:PAS domain S-box-containing protein